MANDKNKPKLQETPPRRGIREMLADTLDMSKEIILDLPKILMIGNRELTIENYKAVIEYTGTLIRVGTNSHTLKISGKNLEIKNITQEMLYITGSVFTFEFVKQ